jgi:hypothetical protein
MTMVDISNNPRVSQLLGRVEGARKDHVLAEDELASPEVDRLVDEAYREIGQYVHWLLRQDRDAVQRIAQEAEQWVKKQAQLLAQDAEEDLDELDIVDLEMTGVESMGLLEEELGEMGISDLDTGMVEILDDDADSQEISLDAHELPEVPELGDGVPWGRVVTDLLNMVGPPVRVETDEETKRRAARLLNATTDMRVRWMDLPDSIQLTLVGYIASLGRDLVDVELVEVDIRLMIGRLRRYRQTAGLPPVVALDPDGRSEYDDWVADAQRWWRALVLGLRA